MARIRTSESARSFGGATLVAVPPWQNSAMPRTSPGGAWLSTVARVIQRFPALFSRNVVQVFGRGAGSGGRSGPAAPPPPGGGAPGPEQRPADGGGAGPPLERPAHPAQQAAAQRDEDGQDQPHPQPAG